MEKLAMLATLPWEQLEGPRWGTASYKRDLSPTWRLLFCLSVAGLLVLPSFLTLPPHQGLSE